MVKKLTSKINKIVLEKSIYFSKLYPFKKL